MIPLPVKLKFPELPSCGNIYVGENLGLQARKIQKRNDGKYNCSLLWMKQSQKELQQPLSFPDLLWHNNYGVLTAAALFL